MKVTKKQLEERVAVLESQIAFYDELVEKLQITIKMWSPIKSVKMSILGHEVDIVGVDVRAKSEAIGK